ncbi:3-oxoacyl-[acyl-carrier-protein] reductase [Thalassospira alkalitolerans]|uniref:3-oxoacyl-[acyl-carrier-protein] reductase n=1 Tax=Thalassospira alkalitolerans TaxID=1293890 RepID=UPI003AA87E1C
MFDLAGKTALVTGATGGIGGDIAKLLASAGAKVALSGTRAERLEAVAAEIGENAVIVPGNLSDPESVANLIKQTEAALGGQLDILVNNAGITRDQLAMRLKDEDWQAVIDVNLTAAFKLARNSLRGMMKRRHGRIINITSIVGVTGNPGQTNYAAAKAGMIGWSKSLAQEVASRGITVNCVAPGFITTAMTNELDEGQKEKLLSNIPAGRMGESTEIAAAVLYLASDEAAYVTGQTLHVNGGMAMI